MSTNNLMTIEITPDSVILAPEAVERRAFYLHSQDRMLFAWMHTLRNSKMLDHGVVICAPIGFEQLHSHRALRHLADQLAGRRIPTLRFDWHGTGDSAGDDTEAGRLTAWRADVRSAIRWMKTELHCRCVSIVGLRLGATLAALGVDDDQANVENLVLWAPVTNGRNYVREMTVVDLTSEARIARESDCSTAIDAAGFLLSEETATELTQLSLLQSRPQCRRVLLGTREETAVDQRLIDRFTHLNIPTDVCELGGVAQMLVEPHRSQLPVDSIHKIATWLSRQVAGGEFDPAKCELNQESASMETRMEVSPPERGCAAIHEEVFRISQSPDLFGIVTRPASPVDDDLPLVVLLNGGPAYRIGPGRMNVEMARRFASLGFTCLRLDLCGLGDSVATTMSEENDSYNGTMFRDIEITLQQAHDRLGMRRCVLMGLCSGAYAAFQSAAQVVNPALIESILINPLTFFWRDGMTLESSPWKQNVVRQYYWNAALRPEKWLKLLQGKTQIGLTGAVRILAERLGIASRRSQPSPQVFSCHSYPTHPAIQDLPADLDRVTEKGRHLSMLFAISDDGYGILMNQAEQTVRQMISHGQLDLTFVDDSDHTFSRRSARHRLIQELAVHLCRRYIDAQDDNPLPGCDAIRTKTKA